MKYTVVDAVLVPAYVPECEYAAGFALIEHDAPAHRSPVFAMVAPPDGKVPPSSRKV